MHKYFAKTLFLGKKVEYLPQCHSTNDHLMRRVRQGLVKEGDLVVTDYQSGGKGQRGNAWLSEPGKNLLFSIYLKPTFLQPREMYLLNISAGLAVCDAVARYVKGLLEVKWPNDVYFNDAKLAGILIETNLGNSTVEGAIVGIGLNVNQSFFPQANATSVQQATGKAIDREELLEEVLCQMEAYYLQLKAGKKEKLIASYYRVMRWRGEERQFSAKGEKFTGEIIGVSDTGKLVVKANNMLRHFDVKDIEFLH